VVFFEAAACLSRRREACVTVVAGVTAARRPEEALFRVQSFGAATAVAPLDAEAAADAAGLVAEGDAALGAAAAGMAGLETEETACLVVSRRRFHMGAGVAAASPPPPVRDAAADSGGARARARERV
jgi:hypothetical protein